MAKGFIKDVSQVFSSGNPIPSRWGNLEQEDGVRLSDGLVDHHARYHNSAIHTTDFKMPNTAGADIVTLAAGTYFTVGGVTFSTDDLTSRELTIPDNATRYAYLAVADDCGALVDWDAAPLVRKKTVSLTLEDTEQATTPAKLLVLKAVKGASGTVPTVTAYEANGGSSIAAVDVSFDPTDTGLPGDPANVQAAIAAIGHLTPLASPYTVLSAGASTSYTAIDLSAAGVPPNATWVLIDVWVRYTASTTGTFGIWVDLRPYGSSADPYQQLRTNSYSPSGYVLGVRAQLLIPCTSQQIEYKVDNNPTGQAADIIVVGYVS